MPEGRSEHALGVPGPKDIARAVVWSTAIEQDADMWTLLSDEQQAMVLRRIDWVAAHIGSSKAAS